ncbi:hypothetical protein BC833DRAFT_611189 [Globomyces pollinis-pini]|nr:hypothetical protein BC833DRAFT_611189 [Globomyces pollinis-pini]
MVYKRHETRNCLPLMLSFQIANPPIQSPAIEATTEVVAAMQAHFVSLLPEPNGRGSVIAKKDTNLAQYQRYQKIKHLLKSFPTTIDSAIELCNKIAPQSKSELLPILLTNFKHQLVHYKSIWENQLKTKDWKHYNFASQLQENFQQVDKIVKHWIKTLNDELKAGTLDDEIKNGPKKEIKTVNKEQPKPAAVRATIEKATLVVKEKSPVNATLEVVKDVIPAATPNDPTSSYDSLVKGTITISLIIGVGIVSYLTFRKFSR